MNAPAVLPAGPSGLAATRQAGGLVPLSAEGLIAKALDAGLPVDTLERLLAMRAELRREEARAAFFSALAQFQSQVPPINKGKVANIRPRQGAPYSYRFANVADIQRAIAPGLAACGLSVTFDTTATPGGFTVTCLVHHVEGHTETASFPVQIGTSAQMNPTQAAGSALTYGRRYALCAALGIVTAEDDDDAQATDQDPFDPHPGPNQPTAPAPQRAPSGPPPPAQTQGAPINEAQHRRLEARIGELGLDRARVKAWVLRAWNVAHLTEVPRDRYSDLDRRLDLWAEATTEAQAERAAIQGEPQTNADWVADYDTANQ